jgi:hypothetical protein
LVVVLDAGWGPLEVGAAMVMLHGPSGVKEGFRNLARQAIGGKTRMERGD